MTDSADPIQITLPNGIKYVQPIGLFINNQFVKSKDGAKFEVHNPATEELITSIYEAKEADVDEAVDAAEYAFYKGDWGKTNAEQRGRLMYKLADIIEKNALLLASIEVYDNGKAIQLAKGDIGMVVSTFRYYAGWADKIHGKVIETDNSTSFNYTKQEPIGVVGQIIPWNFPLLMFAWKLGPALATGNTIVLKTAEQTPLSALVVCQFIREAGFPPGTVNVISGFGRIAGAAIASHMKIHKIAFTGSTLVGRSILKAAAESNLKKVTLELGGKSPNIILNDADIEKAVEWVNFGIYYNAGQCCCAGSRVYVQEDIYDKVVAAFKERALKNIVGDPFDESTFQGAQVSKNQYDRIMNYIDIGQKEGATIVCGGARHGKTGFFIQPTIFADVHHNMKIMQEEIFGPVCAISKFKDINHVIESANGTSYGLAAAVHTKNIKDALEISNRLQAGTVWINSYNSLHHALPFGGYNESGIGRELGKEALRNYTHVKTVSININ